MTRALFRCFVVPCLLLACASTAPSQTAVKLGAPAADFPPGIFADGKSYSLADMEGRAVALYFFCKK
jgi:hypothetical protein